MSLADRIGIEVGELLGIREAVEWAGGHGVRYIDLKAEAALADGLPDGEAAAIRGLAEELDVSIGLHTHSAVNVAEVAPFVDEATDDYLAAYVEVADAVGADRLVVHGGYHFSSDVERRFEAAIDRLERTLELAAGTDVTLLLENHNPEPDRAEVHYVPASPAECERFFEALPTTGLGWAFNPPHANLHSVGIGGFVDAMGIDRCGEVRLNDNRGTHEEHLAPGDGEIDFEWLFDRLEGDGYDGHYVLAHGDLADRLAGREYLLELLE